ncbi:Hint domain-containing protein [Antarctobacter sp.]|uniref:Hint domain-containing protein n=1 Tax=Antarctobacter sp. TaxID=1872577 RepID=UPI003A9137B1
MATFTITHTVAYDYGSPAGTTGTYLPPPQATNATLDDGEADTFFEIGDTVTLAGVTYSYQGKVLIDGTEFPIFNYVDSNPFQFRLVMMDQEPVSPPASLPDSAIDSGDYNTVCFAAGTRIATARGEQTVDSLSIGDLVLTQDGDLVPVKWVGRQTRLTGFSGGGLQPVCIAAGALGGGLPHSDLTVTADHGMILDGVVINASALVNGSTICFVPLAELEDRITVYHVETEGHEIILANGAPSETFIDYRDRRAFDNFQEYVDLYGCERIIPEMTRPRISSARLLPEAIRDRLKSPADDELVLSA